MFILRFEAGICRIFVCVDRRSGDYMLSDKTAQFSAICPCYALDLNPPIPRSRTHYSLLTDRAPSQI